MLEKYGAKKELRKRVMKFGNERSRIEYLRNVLKKKEMLQETTKNAAYSLLGDIYLESGKKSFYSRDGNEGIINAVKNYINAGEINKAEDLIGRTFKLRPDNPEQSGFPALVGIAIGSNSYQGKELYSLIDERKNNKKRKKDLTARISSVAASVFLLGGFIFMVFPNLTTTGNVIGSSSGADVSFFLSFVLMILGGSLLFKSLRN